MLNLKEITVTLWHKSWLGRAILVVPPVLVVLLVVWAFRARPASQYYTAKVERGDIIQIVTATGTINAVTSVQVGSQVSGNISGILVDFNSRVKKGQLIAQIDPSLFQAQLQQAEADLANANANVASLQAQIETQRADVLASKAGVDKAQAQLNDAQLQLRRTRDLADQGIFPVSQKDTAQANADAALATLHSSEALLEQSKAKLNASIAQLEQAKAQVKQRKAAVDMARLNLDHTHIFAPIDGTVIARNVDVGQTVAASFQSPTLFVIAQDLTKMLVYAKTDEADVGRIKVGATATFKVDSFPRETFSGRVSQVRMNATTIQNVVTYDTIIEFDNPDQKLFPGMTAYVSIPVAWEYDAVKIPNGALRFKPDISEDEKRALFAKYNIPLPGRLTGGSAQNGGAAGPGAAAGAGGGQQGGRGRRGHGANDAAATERGPQAATGAAPGASLRDDWGIVWKLRPDKSLEPVRVKLGVTDFTFTAMKEGNLKAGDELVIGQATSKAQPQQGPMGGPGGFPRRM
jgi:HlyD family secretion protein